MTIRAMNWAWGINIDPAVKLVLLKIADRANDDGECWPGNASIAKDCCISERTLGRYLGKLEELGLIKVKRNFDRHGHRAANSYLLDLSVSLSDNLSGGESESLDDNLSDRPKRQIVQSLSDTVGVYISNVEPTIEPTDATTKVAAPIVDDAVQFTGTDGTGWIVDEAVYDTWIEAYANGRTHQDTEDWIEAELQKARVWLFANPRKRKKNWMRFITGWLTRASDSMKTRPQRYQQRPYH